MRNSNRLTVTEMRDFWQNRRRDGDISRVALNTYYSESHVSNMTNGRRRMQDRVARELYRISRRRTENSILQARYPNVNVEIEFAPAR